MSRFLCLCLLLFGIPATAMTDVSQARAMVVFLRTVATGQDAHQLVDPLMALPGTRLLIEQQNISRHVTTEEYREVLLAIAEHREPRLVVSETDPRAVKGKQGLLQDVFPSLRWGCEHVRVLEAEIAAIEHTDVDAEARKLALQNLPEAVPLGLPMYFVMGGRAGAAATDSGIYFDLLISMYRDQGKTPTSQELVEFFGHEMHHVGLGQILDRRAAQLHLDQHEQMAFDFLRALVMEGSASYLINGHRDLTAMRKQQMFAAPGDDQSRLSAAASLLEGVLREHWSRDHYDQARTEFSGNMLHITGATMLDSIWHDGGRADVMSVLKDPRQLLERYNRSVRTRPNAFHFSQQLASQLGSLGK